MFRSALALLAGVNSIKPVESMECDVWAQVGGPLTIEQTPNGPIYPFWNAQFMSSNPDNPASVIYFSYQTDIYESNGTILSNFPFYDMRCPTRMTGDTYLGLNTCTGYDFTTDEFSQAAYNFSTILNPFVDPSKYYIGNMSIISEGGCPQVLINGDGTVFKAFLSKNTTSLRGTALASSP